MVTNYSYDKHNRTFSNLNCRQQHEKKPTNCILEIPKYAKTFNYIISEKKQQQQKHF